MGILRELGDDASLVLAEAAERAHTTEEMVRRAVTQSGPRPTDGQYRLQLTACTMGEFVSAARHSFT